MAAQAGWFAGGRRDGEQVGPPGPGGRGEQAGGHGLEPAEPHDAAARRAIDAQPVEPAGVPAGSAEHDLGDRAAAPVDGQDQPGQFGDRVG